MDKLRNCMVIAAVLMVLETPFAMAQTTVAGSVYGAFRSSTKTVISTNLTVENPSNAAGFLLELRHISNPLMGYEVSYSYHRANEAYSNTLNVICPAGPAGGCPEQITTASVPANAQEVTGDWVFSFRLANLKPFALVGGGALVNSPTTGNVTVTTTDFYPLTNMASQSTSSAPTQTETKGVFQYGAGLDWTVLPHIGLRFQYRGNVYKAAALTKVFTSTDKFTQDAEPVVGVFIRF